MTVRELVEQMQLTVFSGQAHLDNKIEGGYVSDLLSDVLGFAQKGDVWITLHTHKNVLAVATQKELACVVLVKGNQPDEDMLEQADKEKIPVLGTSAQTFETVGNIYKLLNIR